MFKLCWLSLFMPMITSSKNLHCAILSFAISNSIDNRSMQQISFKSLQTCNLHILEPRWRSFKYLFNVHQWPSYPLHFRWLKRSSLSDESWMLWVALLTLNNLRWKGRTLRVGTWESALARCKMWAFAWV